MKRIPPKGGSSTAPKKLSEAELDRRAEDAAMRVLLKLFAANVAREARREERERIAVLLEALDELRTPKECAVAVRACGGEAQ